jgi:hypothetical protein
MKESAVRHILPILGLLGVAVLGPAVAADADPGAARTCPPYSFLNNVNYASNPSFEVAGPNGTLSTWQNGGSVPAPSAAAGWFMHSSNAGARVLSELITTQAPGPNGARMLRFVAGGNEGGIYQLLANAPAKVMFSAWVFVRSGRAELQTDALTLGPVAWTSKIGEWEQLRVCTDGTVPPGWFLIYNQNATGGEFYVDRVEIRAIP